MPKIPHIASRTFLALPALMLPGVALAAAPRTFGDVAGVTLKILGQATLVLMIAAIAIYFGHVAINIFKTSKGETGVQRSALLWGLVIIFVMVSIWGIIQILQNTIFNDVGAGGGGSAQPSCGGLGDAGCDIISI